MIADLELKEANRLLAARWETGDRDLVQAFHQGEASARRDGYLSDNHYPADSDLWAAWRIGFDIEEGPLYTVARPR